MFSAVIEEKINYSDYLKCAHIVKNVFYFDLEDLKNKHESDNIYTKIGQGFTENGLVEVGALGNHKSTLTEIGKIIIEIGMK